MALFYTDRAKGDLQLAYAWYEECHSGLGDDFLLEIELGIHRILSQPKSYSVAYKSFRSCPIKRFPYSIFYTLEGENILVHAIFDQRQHPVKLP